MNTDLSPPDCPALLTDGPPTFNIVMIYEDADAGRHAKRFSDKLLKEIGDECECVRNLWSFDVLGITEVRNAAAGTARHADLVIVSASGARALSPQVEKWLELWAWLIDGTSPALIALFQKPAGNHTQGIHSTLRRLAAEKGLRFFPHATFQAKSDLVYPSPQPLAHTGPGWQPNQASSGIVDAMATPPVYFHTGGVAGVNRRTRL